MSPVRRSAHGVSVALALVCTASAAIASDPLVADLERRLARSGVDAVNAHLMAHWSSAMLPLHRRPPRANAPR